MCQAHLIPKLDAHFLSHSGCHRHGSHSARLRTSDLHASFSVALRDEQQVGKVDFFSKLQLVLSCHADHITFVCRGVETAATIIMWEQLEFTLRR